MNLADDTTRYPEFARAQRRDCTRSRTEVPRMTATLLIEQVLNGLQFGVMLFLMAAGLTLVFGVMGLINLAHGSLYMVGAFACAARRRRHRHLPARPRRGAGRRRRRRGDRRGRVLRRLYGRDHLDQVLATFALILVFSEGTRWLFGSFPLYLDVPDALVRHRPILRRPPLSALPAGDHRRRRRWSPSASFS